MEIIDNNYVYFVDLHGLADAFVMPCADGLSIYIDVNLPKEKQLEAYYHEISHEHDYSKCNVDLIEFIAHQRGR